MSGAQAKAAVIAGCVGVIAEVICSCLLALLHPWEENLLVNTVGEL